MTLIYLCASVIAETISLFMYYPYEMMKVRIIAKNDKYNYKSVSDGFLQVIKQDGVLGLFKGSQHFLFNYVMSYSIQMVIYETYMDQKKRKGGIK